MGSKYPILPPKTIIKILKKLGFSADKMGLILSVF